jgi:hypothetical protein
MKHPENPYLKIKFKSIKIDREILIFLLPV